MDALSFPLGPAPWSILPLVVPQGKSNKSFPAPYLVRDVVKHIQSPSARTMDKMSLLQKAKAENKDVGQVAEMVMATALRESW